MIVNVICHQSNFFCCSSGIAFTHAIVVVFFIFIVVRDKESIVVDILISAFVIRKCVICAINIVVRVRIFPLNTINDKERCLFVNGKGRNSLH